MQQSHPPPHPSSSSPSFLFYFPSPFSISWTSFWQNPSSPHPRQLEALFYPTAGVRENVASPSLWNPEGRCVLPTSLPASGHIWGKDFLSSHKWHRPLWWCWPLSYDLLSLSWQLSAVEQWHHPMAERQGEAKYLWSWEDTRGELCDFTFLGFVQHWR